MLIIHATHQMSLWDNKDIYNLLIRVSVTPKNKVCSKMPSRIHAAQVCDARDDDSSTAADLIISISSTIHIEKVSTAYAIVIKYKNGND